MLYYLGKGTEFKKERTAKNGTVVERIKGS